MGFVSRPYGLDMNAVLALAQAHDALGPLFFDCLPAVERIIVAGPSAEDVDEDESGE